MAKRVPASEPARDEGDEPAGVLTRWGRWLPATVIVLTVWAAYANSFGAPFIFDDLKSIILNPTIRQLWPLSDVLSPPNTLTGAAGRPVVNFTLAVNYALGGLDVRGYHALNTLIHALAALALFGIVRRTLLRPVLRERFGEGALPLGLAVALVWALHPLLTESVTCVVQRTESLMGLFYLLTLYGFIRAVESPSPRGWEISTVIVCLLGMATKEVMVSAPLLVLLYDRTFVAGGFRAAWVQRRGFYLALASTWLLLGWLAFSAGQRGGVAGFGLGVSAWDYALTQCRAIILYLRLALWPSPLVLDYGSGLAGTVREVWPQAVLLLALVTGTFLALWRRPVIGFLGFWFFAILAPSSSFVPLTSQTMAEHRMYLSLVAVVCLGVLGSYRWLGGRMVPVWLVLAAGLGWLTGLRNEDYRDAVTLWSVTVARQPDNLRVHTNLGTALAAARRLEEARRHFAFVVERDPDDGMARCNLANVLLELGRPAEALPQAEAAVRLKPAALDARIALGSALAQLGRLEEAVVQGREAVRIEPDSLAGHYNLATALSELRRYPEAETHYVAALRLEPQFPRAHNDLGEVLGHLGRWDEARVEFETALSQSPGYAQARENLDRISRRRLGPSGR
jgi:tetratricopeptide (TPR) repeat protein